jgi:hypothetical protein
VRAWIVVLAGCGRLSFDDVGARDASPGIDAVAATTTDAPVDASPAARGPVAHYAMDALAGVTIADITGNSHTARCRAGACPTAVDGQRGGALAWRDGELARVPFATDLAGATGFTIAAWLWFDSVPDTAQRFGCVFSKLLGDDNGNSWQICVQSDGKLNAFSVGGGGSDEVVTPSAITLTTWHHVAVSWDGARKVLWLEGTPAVEREVAIDFDDGEVVIGGDIDDGAPNNAFHGRIDDLRIYDRVLAPAELAALATP